MCLCYVFVNCLVMFFQVNVCIYFDIFSEIVLVFQCEETHVICVDCFARYVESKLNQRQFVLSGEIGYTLSCPGLGGMFMFLFIGILEPPN